MSIDSGSNNEKFLNFRQEENKKNTLPTEQDQDKEEYKREIIFNVEIFKTAFKKINKTLEDTITKKDLIQFLDNNMEKVKTI